MAERSEVSALLSPSRRRSQAHGGDAVAAPTRVQITIEALEDEAFLCSLEEQLQRHVEELDQVDLVLGAKQINYLAFRLHEALEPKRDPETNVIQAWTIQPQAQLKIKMSSHIQVLKLSTILREVRRLRIHQQSLLRSPIEIDIFPSLRSIEIVHTEAAVLFNVHFFARQLRKFRLEHTPLENLKQIFSPSTADGEPLLLWKMLESLRINCCSLPSVDACLNKLEAVKVVDLAWNEITRFDVPLQIPSLQWLDLRHNKLTAFPSLSELRNIKVLDLSVNQIQSLEGVQYLPSLIDLDVSNNQLRDVGEIELLLRLHELRRLVVRENPIARRPDYRREILFFLGERVEVDDEGWTAVEIQTMKSSRQLQRDDPMALQSVPLDWTPAMIADQGEGWPRTSGTMVYPSLAKSAAFRPRFADITPPPRVYSPRWRNVQAPTQMAVRSASKLKASSTLDRTGTRSSAEGTLTELTDENDDLERATKPAIKTVDDFFRLQSADYRTRGLKHPNELDIPVDGLIDYDSDSDSSTEKGRNRSRKYTESDFMRDFEEEEAVGPLDQVVRGRRSSSMTHKQGREQAPAGGRIHVRILLSAEDAAVYDLAFGIDGLAATVEVKSNEILETLQVPDRGSSIAFSRRLPDVIAIGSSTQSARGKIVLLRLRKLDPLLGSVTYQIETTAIFGRLLAPLLGHFHATTTGHAPPTVCVCSNCGGISHLSPEYVDATMSSAVGPLNAVGIVSCLLCSSYNVRELSTDRMLALYNADGIPSVAKRVRPPMERRSQVEVGFSVEEQELSVREALDIQEVAFLSSNGIREIVGASLPLTIVET